MARRWCSTPKGLEALQAALKSDAGAVVYYAFDLLSLDGEDLTPLALLERKEELRAPIREGLQRIRYSEHIQGSGERLLDTFCAAGLEALRTSPATRHR